MEVQEDPVRLAVCHDDGVATVHAAGALDMASCERVRAAIDRALERETTLLVLDLEQVRLIDSSALRCLVLTVARCEGQGVAFEIATSPMVRRVLELAGIAQPEDGAVLRPRLPRAGAGRRAWAGP
jgi:anti-sigma B factor antagonist